MTTLRRLSQKPPAVVWRMAVSLAVRLAVEDWKSKQENWRLKTLEEPLSDCPLEWVIMETLF